MLTRTICCAMVALIGYGVMPTQDKKNSFDMREEVAAVQLDLADVVEQLSQNERIVALADSLQGLQNQNNEMLVKLDALSAQLRKANSVKYVTKTDLDDALATAKETVTQAKAATSFGCECDCGTKIAALEARIATLEATCGARASTTSYSTKTGGSTGSLSSTSQTYSTVQTSQAVQSMPMVQSVGNGGCTGSVSTSYYAQSQPSYSPQSVSIDIPEQTRTVRVIEPRTRRQVSFAEVPENSDVSLSYQAVPQASTQQCYTDANGNRVCPPSAAMPVQATQRPRLGSRLFGR